MERTFPSNLLQSQTSTAFMKFSLHKIIEYFHLVYDISSKVFL